MSTGPDFPCSERHPSILRTKHRWLVVIMITLIGCSPGPMIVRQTADLLETGVVAFERDPDLVLVEAALPATIKLLESLLVNSPDDPRLLLLLSRLYGSYAFGFVETRLEMARYATPPAAPSTISQLQQQGSRYHERGLSFALATLEAKKPGAAEAFRTVNSVSPYLERLTAEEAGPLFWYGFNLGAWVQYNRDSVRALAQGQLAHRVMARVLELDPAYSHGGAHLFMIVYFGSRSPMLGGDPEAAKTHYRQLKAIVGEDYLLADLIYARASLYQQQDREGFVDTMQTIIKNAPAGEEVALYNAIATHRAAFYLSAIDRLFP